MTKTPFFLCKFGFGKCFGASSQSYHWVGHCQLLYKIHYLLHVTIQLGNGLLLLHRIRQHFRTTIFFNLWSADETPTYQTFSPFWFTSNAKQHRMVDIEFLGNFSCGCKRVIFDDPLSWSLSTSDGWPLCSLSSRLSSPLQNFLNHHCTVHSLAVPGPNVLLMLRVVSAALWPILNLV